MFVRHTETLWSPYLFLPYQNRDKIMFFKPYCRRIRGNYRGVPVDAIKGKTNVIVTQTIPKRYIFIFNESERLKIGTGEGIIWYHSKLEGWRWDSREHAANAHGIKIYWLDHLILRGVRALIRKLRSYKHDSQSPTRKHL